jgi:TPR repeat protein
MYLAGVGVPQDYVQAYMWLNLSAARGMKRAVEERDQLAQSMTPVQIAQAKKLAREWKPTAGR